MNRNILFVIIAIFILALSVFSMSAISAADSANDAYVKKVLKLVKNEREKFNLEKLTLDKYIVSTAKIRVNELNTLFSHTRPNGKLYSAIPSKIKG